LPWSYHPSFLARFGRDREAGCNAWKSYMRRVTSTINFGRELPLAHGVRFDIG
jgi:L-aminoadipate-semialdehyde dehydrogenase